MSWNLALSPDTLSSEYHAHQWELPVTFNFDKLSSSDTTTSYVTFAFKCLTLVALFTFFACTCVISNSQGRLKGLLFALFFWALWVLTDIVSWIFAFANVRTNNYFNIDFMVGFFFEQATVCMVVFVLYNLIHGLLGHLTDSGRPFASVTKVHWVVLGFLWALCLADWTLFIVTVVTMIQAKDDFLTEPFLKLDGARSCVLCAIAFEILVWTIYVAVKTSSRRFASKASVPALIFAALSWFGFTAMFCIIAIRYELIENLTSPRWQKVVIAVFKFVLCVGLFIGVTLCVLNWHKLQDPNEKTALAAERAASYDVPPPQPTQASQIYPQETGLYKAYEPSKHSSFHPSSEGSQSVSHPLQNERGQI